MLLLLYYLIEFNVYYIPWYGERDDLRIDNPLRIKKPFIVLEYISDKKSVYLYIFLNIEIFFR